MGCLFDICRKKRIEIIDQKILKIHICGKIDEPIINQVFPQECDIKYNGKNIGEFQWKTEQFTWVAKTYKEKDNKKTFDSIFEEIKNDSNNSINKNHIILSFGDDDNEKLFSKLYEVGSVYLPRFIFITKNEGNYNFKKKQFITNIIYTGLTDVELITHIKSELWEIDCYYNERGNETWTFLPNQLIENLEVSNVSINILLTGISRSGKSTFINILNNNSLLSLENCDKSSVTSKITEYNIFFGKNKSEKDGCIKLIDTAGFNYQTDKKNDMKKISDLSQINKSIFEIIEKYKNKPPLEKIHFVFFFFLEGTPLEGTEKVFEMFSKENYKVLFIINKSTNDEDNGRPTDIRSTLKFLEENGLKNIAIEENIIPCNIVDTNKSKGYGINDIFKRVFNILKKTNKFFNDEQLYNELNEWKENENENFNEEREKKSNEIKTKLTEGNEIFKDYIVDSTYIKKQEAVANKDKEFYMRLTVSNAFIPIPYSDLTVTPLMQGQMIFKILNDFGISWTEINWESFIKYLLGGGIREISHLTINRVNKEVFGGTAKSCLMKIGKMLMAAQSSKATAETMKFVPFLGFIAGSGIGTFINYFSTKKIGDNCIKFCEEYLRNKSLNYIGFFLKNFEIFNNIFKSIENLGKKENWWEYKIKIIKKDEISKINE